MKTLNLIQGSPEWHAHRNKKNVKNASDAPAMLGESPYETRTELLHRKSTGITKPVDAAQQRRFDDGHRYEALARPLAAEIVGAVLYPVTGINGDYSASFDGITMMEDEGFEHKSLNDELRSIMVGNFTGKDLPKYHRIQMEQQLMVCEGARVLFMASKWDGDKLVEKRDVWYYPDQELRQEIIAGWMQFDKDLAAYVPVDIKEMPKAEVVIELPALFVQAVGEITTNNIAEYGEALAKRLAEVRAIKLVNDQDFSNAKSAAAMFREQIKKLAQVKEAMLSQTVSIGEASRMMDAWSEDLRVTALQLEKDVEREDLAKKTAMVNDIKVKFAEHVKTKETEIAPIRLPDLQVNFGEAIKGKRNYTSMQDALDTLLSQSVSRIDAIALDIITKQAWFKEVAAGYELIFMDLQQIISKPLDDFQLLVNSRLSEHKQSEADKAAKLLAESTKQPEPALATAPAQQTVSTETKEVSPAVVSSITTQQAVTENHDVIGAFMKSREFGKDEAKTRAIVVEFVKFQSSYALKAAA